MIDANYQKHLKLLGKLVRLWDDGGSDDDALKLLISRFFDQMATGETDSYDALILLNPYTNALKDAVVAGETQVQLVARTMVETYLKSSIFHSDLTTVPQDASSAKSVLEALQTEMGAGVDNKTLSDVSTTGFVYFFDTVFAPSGSWNTEPDATADYPDSTYVVAAIV